MLVDASQYLKLLWGLKDQLSAALRTMRQLSGPRPIRPSALVGRFWTRNG